MKRIVIAAAVMLTAFTSCNGIFNDIYDSPTGEGVRDDSFSIITTEPLQRFLLRIDASDFETWNYISLHNMTVEKLSVPLACEGEWDGRSGITFQEVNGDRYTELSSFPTDAQPEPAEWDFAIHRFEVRTNGGEVADTGCTSFEALENIDVSTLEFEADIWSKTDVMVNLKDMMAYRIGYQNSYVNAVLSGWVTMDISTPPPTYAATGHVYLMRMCDGNVAAIQMRRYMNEAGVKGHLEIEIIYPWP